MNPVSFGSIFIIKVKDRELANAMANDWSKVQKPSVLLYDVIDVD